MLLIIAVVDVIAIHCSIGVTAAAAAASASAVVVAAAAVTVASNVVVVVVAVVVVVVVAVVMVLVGEGVGGYTAITVGFPGIEKQLNHRCVVLYQCSCPFG